MGNACCVSEDRKADMDEILAIAKEPEQEPECALEEKKELEPDFAEELK